MAEKLSLWNRLKSDFIYLSGLRKIDQRTRPFQPDADILVPDMLEASVDRHSDELAFLFEGQRTTYSDLEARANRFAAWAMASGLKPGDTAALFLDNHPDVIAIWFGLSKVGVTVALINNNLKGDGLLHCLKTAEAKAIISGAALSNAVEDIQGELTDTKLSVLGTSDLSEHGLATLSARRPPRSIRAGLKGKDVALLIYTSGTTGLPKAARMSHARCLTMMSGFIDATRAGPGDRIYETLPLYHGTTGLCGAGTALLSGAAVILRRKFSASQFWQDVHELDATMFVYVGELGRYLMNNPPSPLERGHKLRCAFGNGMRRNIWTEFAARTGVQKIIEFYGSTEGNISLINLDSRPGAVGRIPPIIKDRMPVRLIDVDPATGDVHRTAGGLCREAPTGVPGEAAGKIQEGDSRWRFDGYSDKTATEKKILRNVFEPGDAWFRSGDLLRQDEDGYFYFVDRLGDTFRWKSENVSTSEVEDVLSRSDIVTMSNVFGVAIPHAEGRAGMAAISVSEAPDMRELYRHVTASLPGYARPVFLRVLPDQEITSTMKFRKVDLVRQSYLPSPGEEDVWIIDPSGKTYRPITSADLEQIEAGTIRL
ncbi:long-chain-acyl-CoA synthetase [Henriciella litoralis]|uniref:long-chain-acyl-CoA synthetase n=1 Tax=Henriciella litoralis TaxID=568102 RepID=UPI0009FF8C89|nr:long-chain-acyl-CoA synthetase [Henriciella litoralis]